MNIPELCDVKGATNIAVFTDRPTHLSDHEEKRAQQPEKAILCATCDSPIARRSDILEVNGKHEHTFINPLGVIYRIRCFSAATGIDEVGEPSDEFTWFRGYCWRVAICRNCSNHIGWTFTSSSSQFYGLIAEQISEA
jgi:hypothetical protein